MLVNNNYKCATHDQFILVDEAGCILETDSVFFSDAIGESINDVHPFFESLSVLQSSTEETYDFSAVHITINDVDYIFDISFKTFKNDTNTLIILNDFTKLYSEYYTLTQNRNDSIINKELIVLKNDLLIKKEKFKSRFLANFSHSIKTPIHNLKGFSNLLEQTNLDLVQRNQLQVIQSTSNNLYTMINNILDISKIETGYYSLQNNSFNSHDVFKKLITSYQIKCDEKGLKFNSSIDKNLPKFIIGDKYRLNQILNNILDNALKFTLQGGIDFDISGKINNNNLDITFKIKDSGIGIKEEDQSLIFKCFYKLSDDKSNKGSGLGLAMVKHLVKVMDGEILLKSNEGAGSTFEIKLNYEISNNQIEQELKPISIKKKDTASKYKILVAEALEIDQHTIKAVFDNYEDYQMDLVESGDDVIKQLQKNHYDLLILNIKIPTMDGFDTARFIRHSEVNNFTRIPIIAVGGSFSEEEKESCLKKDMNNYIAKPYNSEELLKEMALLIKKYKN